MSWMEPVAGLLFISVTSFSDLCNKKYICDKNEDKKFYMTAEVSFKWLPFDSIAIKSLIKSLQWCPFVKIGNNFFSKKVPPQMFDCLAKTHLCLQRKNQLSYDLT